MKFLNQSNLESVLSKMKDHMENNYASKNFVESNLVFASDTEVDNALVDIFGSASVVELNEDSIDLIVNETIDDNDKE